ncbi:DUF7352 domain-containing protein [Leucobacter chromiiresistens]
MTNQQPQRIIFRYEIPVDDDFHEVPVGTIVLATPHRRLGHGWVEVWVLHAPEESEVVELTVVGTGHPVPPNLKHEHSVRADPLVWHIFSAEVAS